MHVLCNIQKAKLLHVQDCCFHTGSWCHWIYDQHHLCQDSSPPLPVPELFKLFKTFLKLFLWQGSLPPLPVPEGNAHVPQPLQKSTGGSNHKHHHHCRCEHCHLHWINLSLQTLLLRSQASRWSNLRKKLGAVGNLIIFICHHYYANIAHCNAVYVKEENEREIKSFVEGK